MEQVEIIEMFENDIDLYLHQFCEEQNITDMREQPQSVWNGCLRYIYKRVFKGKRALMNDQVIANHNMYDYKLLLELVDYYIYDMCMIYNKEVSILGFTTLTGIDESVVYVWGNNENKLSTIPFEIYKKLSAMREESLSNKLADGRKNPVGILAILNRHYQWNLPGVSKEPAKKSLGVEELPQLNSPKDIIDG